MGDAGWAGEAGEVAADEGGVVLHGGRVQMMLHKGLTRTTQTQDRGLICRC